MLSGLVTGEVVPIATANAEPKTDPTVVIEEKKQAQEENDTITGATTRTR